MGRNAVFDAFDEWELTQPLHDVCHECSRDEFTAFMAGYGAALDRLSEVTSRTHEKLWERVENTDAVMGLEDFAVAILGVIAKARTEIPASDDTEYE
jgi:hypothetical protein